MRSKHSELGERIQCKLGSWGVRFNQRLGRSRSGRACDEENTAGVDWTFILVAARELCGAITVVNEHSAQTQDWREQDP